MKPLKRNARMRKGKRNGDPKSVRLTCTSSFKRVTCLPPALERGRGKTGKKDVS